MNYIDELTGKKFYFNEAVYNPGYTQPDVILIADRVLKMVPEVLLPSVKVLDYGCGTGYLGLATYAFNPGIDLYLYDPSKEACRVSKLNAKRQGVPANVDTKVDWNLEYHTIIANLPTYDPEQMASETLRGPKMAYEGGEDGLDHYRTLLEDAKNRCGVLVLECQAKRQPALKALASSLGWELFFETNYGFAFTYTSPIEVPPTQSILLQ